MAYKERNTEEIIETFYRNAAKERSLVIDRQGCPSRPDLDALIKSKRGTGKKGSPEFVLTSPAFVDWVIVVECKGSTNKHVSAPVGRLTSGSVALSPVSHAVDGVLHYMANLAVATNVIGIALSGDDIHHSISVLHQRKGASTATTLIDPANNQEVNALLQFEQYMSLLDEAKIRQDKDGEDELRRFSKYLHELFRNHFALNEMQKPLFVSAMLIAIQSEDFRDTLKKPKSTDQLITRMFQEISNVLNQAGIETNKVKTMVSEFSFIRTNEKMKDVNEETHRSRLLEVLLLMHDKVYPYMQGISSFDLVGMFYGEFIRYSGGDGKGLGIVLTPRHITELMCKLARVDADSVVLDPCCGTGSFLITAMKEMIYDVSRKNLEQKVRDKRIEQIKSHQLIGIESNGMLYSMAAANMIFRGDGKSNLHHNSCFNSATTSSIVDNSFRRVDFKMPEVIAACTSGRSPLASIAKKFGREASLRPTKCLMNPPYSQEKKQGKKDSGDLNELSFIANGLNILEKGGALACIVPLRVAFSTKKQDILRKEALLREHRLDAVLSMPSDLFHPVGTHTCIMIFTAHVAHDKETWFAYCKNDGFVLDRVNGRADIHGRWPAIFANWISSFSVGDVSNRAFATRRMVSARDEWCAEAYIDTDPDAFKESSIEDFIRTYQLAMLGTPTPAEALGETA